MDQLKISAEIILHSKSRAGAGIVTMSLVYPRFVHSEFMTHRVFSRNAMSSRAVPVAKMIAQVRQSPAMPIHWGTNQPGMQANGEVNAEAKADAISLWRQSAMVAAATAEGMMDLGLHKQVVNRILEPFQWMRTIVTATEWDNFFKLRCHDMAEPNMRALAECMRDALMQSDAVERDFHLPYADKMEISTTGELNNVCMISAARCARVSYLNHDGSAPDMTKDLALADTLKTSGHASPFEHVAFAMKAARGTSRNFTGWLQFRETLGL